MLNKVYLWRNLNFTRMSQGQMEAQRRWFTWAVFGALGVVYLLNRSPYVGFNDGLSFLLAAETGFDLATNATSHFLYNNLLHILVKVFFFLPPVLVLTLFSVGCALGTLGVVYRIGRLLGAGEGMALLPVVVLGMSFTYWQQAEIIEVYAFNNLVFSGFLFFALRDIVGRGPMGRRGLVAARGGYLMVSALLGIGLLTHIQHVLSIPFFLIYLLGGGRFSLVQKVLGMVPWMVLGSLLFILPLVTGLNTWKAVFFESKFQDELLGMDVWALGKGALLGLGILVYNFHLGLWFVARGWSRFWKLHRGVAWLLISLGLPYLGFAMKYAVNDNHVFYLCFYIVMVLPLVFAFDGTGRDVVADAGGLRPLRWIFPVGFLLPVLIYASATLLLAPRIGALQRYDVEKNYKGGVVHLLWPGKAWARDPLEIAWRHAYLCERRYQDSPHEWNYAAAVAYCKILCAEERLPGEWPRRHGEGVAGPCVFHCE
jgi:hypothetical protein